MDFNVTRANNFTFRGTIVQNKVLDKCISHLSPTQLKEYQELVAIANRATDNRVLEVYERTTTVKDKRQFIYRHYVGLRDKVFRKNYGEALVRESSKKGSTNILWGYTDAILKPLRKIYKKSPNTNV